MPSLNYELAPTHPSIGFSVRHMLEASGVAVGDEIKITTSHFSASREGPMNANDGKARVAFLGLGAMGRRMAQRLAGASLELTVWNRSGVGAFAGARHAATVREAVADAQVVFSMVRDDAASRAVWLGTDGALACVGRDTVVVECSTVSPAWVTELSAAVSHAGLQLLEAPVVGSRPQAESGGLVFLAGGAVEVVERLRPLLGHLGSAVHYVGASPAGAYAKLLVNALFGVQVAALAELLGFATKAQLDLRLLLSALEGLPVLSPSAKGAAAGMLARRFEPMFPLDLAAKDLRYLLDTAATLGSRVPMARGVSEVFDGGRARGLERENLTAVAKLYE
jgi:3-hydroxyisobutyrate dehydrogenase